MRPQNICTNGIYYTLLSKKQLMEAIKFVQRRVKEERIQQLGTSFFRPSLLCRRRHAPHLIREEIDRHCWFVDFTIFISTFLIQSQVLSKRSFLSKEK